MLTIIESESVTINLQEEAGIPGDRYILLVSTDLQARVRAQTAAEQAGFRLETRRPDQQPAEGPPPIALILDLDQIDDLAGWLRGRRLGDVRPLGFFSHIDEEAAAAARAADIEAYPRGRFWRQLPDLLAELV